MKKQIIIMICAFVLLTGLLITYFTLSEKQEETADSLGSIAQTVPDVQLPQAPAAEETIPKTEKDIQSVTLTNDKGTLDFVPTEGENDGILWKTKDDKEYKINSYAIDSIIRPIVSLPLTKILDAPNPLEDYGFSEGGAAVVLARYKDGTDKVIKIGNKSPDGTLRYAAADGDAALYTIPDSDAEKFFYGYNEIIDKTMPAVDWATLTYIDINAFGTEIEAEQKDKYYVMTKPYQGREFYPALLAQTANFDGYELGDLVEIGAEDLAKYGLDAPKIKISLKDGGGTFDISVGNGENPDFSYALFEGNVFLVENSMFAGFDEIVPLKLISRFVNLLNIDDVDKINVTISQFFKYEILINHGADGTIAPTINGEPVEETAARDCYQAIIALSADAVVDFDTADSKPAFSVVFTKTDGTVVSSDYYDYDENFFAVELDGTQGKYFAVNKDSVKKILDLIPF